MENLDFGYISQLLQALILAVLPILAAVGVRYLVALGNVKRAEFTNEQRYALDMFVKVAIYAAEQLKVGAYIDSKLDYATELIQGWLDARGLTISAEEIRAQIEAAVRQEFPKQLPAG